MAVDPRVQQLLDELEDSGCTPEEVCAACPELLPEVRRRWRQMCAVKADLHGVPIAAEKLWNSFHNFSAAIGSPTSGTSTGL
jgi:hypothetical protein